MSLSKNFPVVFPTLLLDFANTQRLDPRITFTRASPAVYYDGITTAVAEQNLVLQSQTFDNAYWATQGVTKGTNVTTAPDGTATADSLTETATTGTHQIFPSGATTVVLTTSAVYTWSCFVKPNGRNFASLQLGSYSTGGRYSFAIFDISGGLVTQTGNVGSATYVNSAITSAGSGWYRISLTASLNTGTDGYVSIGCSNSGTPTKTTFGDPTYLGDGTSGIFIWGAQLEQRSAVTAYTPTTTAPITNYIPVLLTAAAGVARFDCNPVTGSSLGLVIEEARTNLLSYSSDFANASWSKTDITLTSNTIVAPDGGITGTKYIPNSLTTAKLLNKNHSITASTALTFSLYIKAGEYNNCVLYFDGLSTGRYGALFDLSNQTATVGSLNTAGTATGFQSITAVGNGWFRCVVGFTDTALNDGAVSTSIRYTAGNAGYPAVAGNDFSGFYIWGAQLEAGAFATTYIATVATTQLREADQASMTGNNFSSWFNISEGSVYTEVLANNYAVAGAQVRRFVEFADDTGDNGFRYGRGATTAIRNQIIKNGALESLTPASASAFETIVVDQTTKFAISYSSSIPSLVLNGVKATDITGGFSPFTNATALYIGNNYAFNAAASLNGTIKKIAYYDIRLTTAQLQTLT
jgi:hypothetical protein